MATVSAPTPIGSNESPDLNTLASQLAREEEPDGAMIHCVSVSILCCKIGRVTVPPALILALNGFTVKEGHNRENPPEAYKRLQAMGKDVKKFLTGGWREEKERWWDEELKSDELDERFKRFEGIRLGMEHFKTL